MARGKKDRKVDTLQHRSGVCVDIFFNPNTDGEFALTFSASVGDKRFRNSDAGLLRREITKYLNDQTALVWHPVIIITEVAPWSPGHAAFVGISVERAYLAAAGDSIRQLSWDDYSAEEGTFGPKPGENVDIYRLTRSQESWRGIKNLPDDLPHTSSSGDKENTVVPYTEELYAGLLEIDSGIRRLKSRLRHLLKTEEGRTKVSAIGTGLLKMLPAPDEE